MTCCREGELFLLLKLTENLTEDTGAGKLILTSVRSALLTRKDLLDKHRVYEAQIEGKGKDYVYVALTPVGVRELKLQAGMSVEVSVLCLGRVSCCARWIPCLIFFFFYTQSSTEEHIRVMQVWTLSCVSLCMRA